MVKARLPEISETDDTVAGSAAPFQVSVCICTRNRPDALCDAVRSVLASDDKAHQVVISDDSTDARSRAMVEAVFAAEMAAGLVVMVEGPRRGLGANRNTALGQATGTHILFIDDDVILSPPFLTEIAAVLAARGQQAAKLIVTGTEMTHGERVFPHKVTYLGHQSVAYRLDDVYDTVVINATVFPRAVFDRVKFDENLVYGCDEMDLTARAVHLHGFQIMLAPDSANNHFPSLVNRDFYTPFHEASRIYITFKRYAWVQRRPAKAWLYLLTAYAHILVHDLRKRGLPGFSAFATTVAKSLAYIRICARDTARFV